MPDPSILFLDTSFIYAIINSKDQWHEMAIDRQRHIDRDDTFLLTTELILVEIADGLSALRFRAAAIKSIEMLSTNRRVEVVPHSAELYERGFEMYKARPDKGWGLTDCVSFTVMADRGITKALTTDDHFRQAGFEALLLEF